MQVEETDSILLIKRVLQKKPWKSCAAALGLTGRKAVEARLRQIIGKLISHYADDEIRRVAHSMASEMV